MKIAVVGMGKIGLPLAVQYAKKGNTVIGIDINPKTVELINQGLEPFPEEAHLKEYLADVVSKGLLKATQDYEEGVKNAEVVVVVVPLFVNEKAVPEFSAIDQATALIGSNLKKGSLICFETTLPIGTTKTRLVPLLEKQSGLKAGTDFNVVFSPERVFTGRIFEDLRKYPKIVGGISQHCTIKGVNFYTQVLDFDSREDLLKPNGVWAVESTESAEFVKLAETTYRDVNIALANQFALHAEKLGVNIYEIIESANSQYFSHIHNPGISVGGHCIPVYPRLYLEGNPTDALVEVARKINESIPEHVVNFIERSIGSLKDLNFLILGVSFRPKVKEHFLSGVFELNDLLNRKGGKIQVLDPLYTKEEIINMGLKSYDGLTEKIDVIIIHTAHLEFIEFLNQNFKNCKLLYDGRNVLKSINKNGVNTKIFGSIY
jgi:UDP-N-acetyl-D-glucosamine dehydrogenase